MAGEKKTFLAFSDKKVYSSTREYFAVCPTKQGRGQGMLQIPAGTFLNRKGPGRVLSRMPAFERGRFDLFQRERACDSGLKLRKDRGLRSGKQTRLKSPAIAVQGG